MPTLFRFVFLQLLVVCLLLIASGCAAQYRMPTTATEVDMALDAGYPDLTVNFDSPLLKKRKIILTTDINPLSGRTIIAHMMYLAELDDTAPIDFYINTSGGDLDIALAIIQTMRQIKPPVNTHALIDVKSGGVLLVAGGTGKRIAYKNSLFTVHGGVASPGTPIDYKDKALNVYHRVILQTMNLPDTWFPLQGGIYRTMTAQQAMQYQVVDEIMDPQHKVSLKR
ncbi:ATP-dependent Clp protease proteolytic subunit [Poriferisphaera sp. WC338]|uniref:ATP-dependent Clp protease proteolytic subunit n=1 Tax=Poriferisphaera sp. WC338 TaxID=3425129 RepID=UPI003D815325